MATPLSPISTNKIMTSTAAEPSKLSSTPPPPNSLPQKRDAPATSATPKRRKSGVQDGVAYCHQCHQRRTSFLKCTAARGSRRCNIAYCETCMQRRYRVNIADVVAVGLPSEESARRGHLVAPDIKYIFCCPSCSGSCDCCMCKKTPDQKAAQAARKKQAAEDKKTQKRVSLSSGQLNAAAAAAANVSQSELIRRLFKLQQAANSVAAALPTGDPSATAPATSTSTAASSDTEMKQATKKMEKLAVKKGKEREKEKEKKAKEPKQKKLGSNQTTIKPTKGFPVPPPSQLPALKPPKHVDTPFFEWITIDWPTPVIHARLRIREFVLRFEKYLSLVNRWTLTINDPNTIWTELVYKNLLTKLLSLLQSDTNIHDVLHPDLLYGAIAEIRKSTTESGQMWEITKNLLTPVFEIPAEIQENPGGDELSKLDLIIWLLELVMETASFHKQLNADMQKRADLEHKEKEELKVLRHDWETEKQNISKARLTAPPDQKPEILRNMAAKKEAHELMLQKVAEKYWQDLRKLSMRTTPLGKDTLGNVYWLYHQKHPDIDDWGQWIVLEKPESLPQPSGKLPPRQPPSPPADAESMDVDGKGQEQVGEELDLVEKVFWAVSGADEITKLANWIKFKHDEAVYQQALKQRQTPAASGTASPASSASGWNGGKLEIRIPEKGKRKKKANRDATEGEIESVDRLVAEIGKIAGHFAVREKAEAIK